jgi:hypothetical protein
MSEESNLRATQGRPRIRQAIAILLLGAVLAVAAMALLGHGEAINHPSSVTTTPPPSAHVDNH